MLSLHAGLRFGEIASLTWGAVDFENNRILILDPKGVVTRRAHMTKEIRQHLEEIRADRPSHEDLVFPARGTTNQQQKHVSTSFYRVAGRLFNKGVKDRRLRINFHSLRHSFCSWLGESGATAFEIMEAAGHKDLAMVKRYTHVAETRQRQAVERMTDDFESSRSRSAVIEALKIRR